MATATSPQMWTKPGCLERRRLWETHRECVRQLITFNLKAPGNREGNSEYEQALERCRDARRLAQEHEEQHGCGR